MGSSCKKFGEQCKFQTSSLEWMMRDQFIVGYELGAVQDRLSEENESLEFSKAVDIAMSEMAATTRSFLSVKTEPGLHFMTSRVSSSKMCSKRKEGDQSSTATSSSSSNFRMPCVVCGKENHAKDQCFFFKNKTCNFCHKIGHISTVYKSKKPKQKSSCENFKYLEESPVLFKLNAHNETLNPINVEVKVESKNVIAEIDTGASISAFSETFYGESFGNHVLQPTQKLIKCYDGKIFLQGELVY